MEFQLALKKLQFQKLAKIEPYIKKKKIKSLADKEQHGSTQSFSEAGPSEPFFAYETAGSVGFSIRVVHRKTGSPESNPWIEILIQCCPLQGKITLFSCKVKIRELHVVSGHFFFAGLRTLGQIKNAYEPHPVKIILLKIDPLLLRGMRLKLNFT